VETSFDFYLKIGSLLEGRIIPELIEYACYETPPAEYEDSEALKRTLEQVEYLQTLIEENFLTDENGNLLVPAQELENLVKTVLENLYLTYPDKDWSKEVKRLKEEFTLTEENASEALAELAEKLRETYERVTEEFVKTVITDEGRDALDEYLAWKKAKELGDQQLINEVKKAVDLENVAKAALETLNATDFEETAPETVAKLIEETEELVLGSQSEELAKQLEEVLKEKVKAAEPESVYEVIKAVAADLVEAALSDEPITVYDEALTDLVNALTDEQWNKVVQEVKEEIEAVDAREPFVETLAVVRYLSEHPKAQTEEGLDALTEVLETALAKAEELLDCQNTEETCGSEEAVNAPKCCIVAYLSSRVDEGEVDTPEEVQNAVENLIALFTDDNLFVPENRVLLWIEF